MARLAVLFAGAVLVLGGCAGDRVRPHSDDTGALDGAADSAATMDAGRDAGVGDGSTDAGSDASPAMPDAAVDAGPVVDAATIDAATFDAATFDAATLDAASVDAATIDAATRDAAAVDAGFDAVTCVPETCNGLDDDCDGALDDGLAPLACGVGACAHTVPACTGGVPQTCTPLPAGTETCNGIDDDCNGTVDDRAPLTCGTGACATTAPACVGGAPGTCTPTSPHPEICGNGIDEDCNGADLVCCTPPANTSCTSALATMVGVTVTGDNTCSGADVVGVVAPGCGTSAGAGNELVYTLASDGTPSSITLRMTGAVGYDTLLHVHGSSACSGTDQLACSDDFGAMNVSQVTVDGLPMGATYYVVADSFGTPASTFTLTSTSAPIDHDRCTSPAPIRGNGAFRGTTTGRANDFTAPAACSGAATGSPDVVYRITARTTGMITVTTAGSTFDTVLYVSTTCGSGGLACNDDFTGLGTRSSVTWSATAGTTYYVVVDGFSAGENGAYVLNVSGY